MTTGDIIFVLTLWGSVYLSGGAVGVWWMMDEHRYVPKPLRWAIFLAWPVVALAFGLRAFFKMMSKD